MVTRSNDPSATRGGVKARTVTGERILIVGPSWVGDMVMAQSLFMTLKARLPGCMIDVVGPAWSLPIIARMPEVRRALTLDVGHGKTGFKARWRLGRQLRGEYDRAIVLPRSWKSALVPFMASVPSRTGFIGEQRFVILNRRRQLNKKILDQTVKRFVSLGLPRGEAYPPQRIPQPKLRVDPDNQAKLVTAHGLSDRPLIGMMPGAEFGPSKQWPLDYFRLLAETLIDAGYAVAVLGGPKDEAAGEKIALGLPHAFNLCGKTSLADAVDVLGLCQQVVTNDSGLMHVAAAVGTRIQAVYGSTSPHYTPPLSDNAEIHWLNLACSPCFERTCPLGHNNCLKHIMPERLHQAIVAGTPANRDVLARQ
ncbi:lipopolysaccharide heptosyltransferase II [Phytohalomonas tamaricis]|uniref:lipopolysaccharide heptosyltransferase II n=1 Tax=Phytohalomonas tamaricis TaxID=2081032 RepID=UPI000D0AD224|nr:lipopolysaccharide heptosyltransferase II [Phytohalomonas tamaricis]